MSGHVVPDFNPLSIFDGEKNQDMLMPFDKSVAINGQVRVAGSIDELCCQCLCCGIIVIS